MRASRGRLRAFFRDDALDEFWHCDAFYFVDNPNLTLDARKVKAYVPLAASTAFEDVALRAADEDWLGHLLIAYFQESSIIFRHDSERFYDSVERHYALPGFFAGWWWHMSLDAEQGHADGLKGLFASDRRVSLPEIARSIRCMQLAHFFLLKALDQIAAHADLETDAVDLRQPASLVKRDGRQDRSNAGTGDPAWGNCLLGSLHEAAFRGLAFARTHDEIMMAGRFSAALKEHAVRLTGTFRQLENPWLVAVHDFLLERSTNVTLLVVLAADILQAAREFNPSLVATMSRLAVSIGGSASCATAEQGQLRELLDLCRSGEILLVLRSACRHPHRQVVEAMRPGPVFELRGTYRVQSKARGRPSCLVGRWAIQDAGELDDAAVNRRLKSHPLWSGGSAVRLRPAFVSRRSGEFADEPDVLYSRATSRRTTGPTPCRRTSSTS